LAQISPVTLSVKAPVERSSTPLNERLPVAPASLPVPLMLDVVAWNWPVAMSNVPATCAVKVPLLTAKTLVPSNDVDTSFNLDRVETSGLEPPTPCLQSRCSTD
jgi:hypothetical protein